MPVRPIIRLGHPALRTPAQPVPPEQIRTGEIQQLVEDMVETMHAAAGVGLAAPQLGVGLQIFVYACEGNDRHADIPLHVVINPMITPHSRELVYDWEGCLSIPDLRGLVPRHPSVRVQGLDREGGRLDYIASDFEARIVQHEYDHLNGIVFLDRMRDLRSLGYTEEWSQYMEGEDGDDTAVG
ncbi:MAG: peptide deformylase [Thermoanaerobaculia bacterium]